MYIPQIYKNTLDNLFDEQPPRRRFKNHIHTEEQKAEAKAKKKKRNISKQSKKKNR